MHKHRKRVVDLERQHVPGGDADERLVAMTQEGLQEGIEVYHAGLKKHGTVKEVLKGGTAAMLDISGLKIQAKLSDLFEPKRDKPKPKDLLTPAQRKAREQHHDDPFAGGRETVVDLRGMRVNEALAEIDKILDEMMLDQSGTLHIIHGHGTTTLKRAVREHLRTSPYVASFEPAPGKKGGDGSTIVTLDL